MSELLINTDYNNWLKELKTNIQQRQIKAAIAVNSQLIRMYWELGKEIVQKQETAKWGTGFIVQLSKDLRAEFPDMGGFSKFNLYHIKNFYLFYSQKIVKVEQAALLLDHSATERLDEKLYDGDNPEFTDNEDKWLFDIPWGHHIVIIQKIKSQPEAFFYVQQTIENNWSRAVLEAQIQTNLFQRQGKSVNNFKETLPATDGDLANELLKDPYNFEFLTFDKNLKERDLEKKLIENITQFLLELGKGFAYMGKQYLLKVGSKEYRTDLLFYHTKLKRYIVIELKTTAFEPEYIGKLNFYLTAVNQLVKDSADHNTIGILLCKNKDNYEVEFALKDLNKPIGVSEYTYTQLPTEIQDALPSQQQFENHLKRAENT
ncbi:MAG: DUF1016 domain-containing protein [Methylotenera sp.]|nr:DUF1016 domain-containing protein [Flavobacterium sp.]